MYSSRLLQKAMIDNYGLMKDPASPAEGWLYMHESLLHGSLIWTAKAAVISSSKLKCGVSLLGEGIGLSRLDTAYM